MEGQPKSKSMFFKFIQKNQKRKNDIQSSPSIVTPNIVTSPFISTFALVQITNKLIKKTPSIVTSYSIFIITPFFFGPKGCDYIGGRLYNKKRVIFEYLKLLHENESGKVKASLDIVKMVFINGGV